MPRTIAGGLFASTNGQPPMRHVAGRIEDRAPRLNHSRILEPLLFSFGVCSALTRSTEGAPAEYADALGSIAAPSILRKPPEMHGVIIESAMHFAPLHLHAAQQLALPVARGAE